MVVDVEPLVPEHTDNNGDLFAEGLLWGGPCSRACLCAGPGTPGTTNWPLTGLLRELGGRPVRAPKASSCSACSWVTLARYFMLCGSQFYNVQADVNEMLAIPSLSSHCMSISWVACIWMCFVNWETLFQHRKMGGQGSQTKIGVCHPSPTNVTSSSLSSPGRMVPALCSHTSPGEIRSRSIKPFVSCYHSLALKGSLWARKTIHVHYLLQSLKRNYRSYHASKGTGAWRIR